MNIFICRVKRYSSHSFLLIRAKNILHCKMLIKRSGYIGRNGVGKITQLKGYGLWDDYSFYHILK